MAKSLYIIDGHAQIFSAYFAPTGGNMSSSTGEPTKATLIFTTMLIKLIKERRPDYLVVAMDSGGQTFRHEIYPEYKANRPEVPEDLPVQVERIVEILEAMRIPVLRLPGYEADDIIGTLSSRALAEGFETFICSKDKDLEQLLGEGVKMYDPRKDEETDVAALKEKKGIEPQQVVDVLALAGDTSDNIPGVPDVGPKTAAQWIAKYGSLDGLLAHADEIKGKRGDNLRANVEQAELSRKLATINLDVPLVYEWEDMKQVSGDRQKLEQLFEELNFRRLLDQLDDISGETETDVKNLATLRNKIEKEYILVEDEGGFKDFLAELKKQKRFAIDTETTSVNARAAELVGLSFSWQAEQGYYLPVKGPMTSPVLDWSAVREELRPILEDENIAKIGQNIKYDIIILRGAGIELAGVDFDTMVASYLLHSERNRHNMDDMAADYLGHETIKIDSLIGKGKKQITFDMVDTVVASDYAAEDADITWRLWEYLAGQFKDAELKKLFDEVEMPLVGVLAKVEYNGVALDVTGLRKLATQLGKRMEELVDEICAAAGVTFNVESPKQLGEVLFERLGLEVVKKTKSGPSTDVEVLEALQWKHDVPRLMLEYRQLSKLKSTYIDKLPIMINSGTGRLHASFNQTVAATGRLSSSDPNLQNIPIRTELGQEIRRAFVPGDKDAVLLAADYSQIELRMLAHFSKDEALLKAFESGEDIHRFVASQIYGVAPDEVTTEMRGRAKAVNFGIIYGQTSFGLSRGTGMPRDEAQKFIDDYFARYPQIKGFMDGIIEQAKKDSFVRTILGRRRTIADLNSRNFNQRKMGERMAVNTVIQGSAADMIKVAMVRLQKRIETEHLAMKMLMQVHDELVFELPREKAQDYGEIVRAEMANALKLDVAMKVDVGWGDNWLECK